MLKELEGEAAESVAVGNHNFFDIAAHRSVQNGEKAGALPVDTRSDVCDDFVPGAGEAESFNLSFEVVALFLAGHARVANFGFCVDGIGRKFPEEESGNISGAVEAFTFTASPNGANRPSSRIFGGCCYKPQTVCE